MASIDPYAVGADSISARARLPYPQTRPVYNPLRACTYCATLYTKMYLSLSRHCHTDTYGNH